LFTSTPVSYNIFECKNIFFSLIIIKITKSNPITNE